MSYVLLRHTTPVGSWHFDWMIQPSPGAPLVTFRTMHDPTDPTVHQFPAERLSDHRPAYLEYEGELSNQRGFVERVMSGRALILRDDADAIEIQLAAPRPRSWRGEAQTARVYAFRCLG